MLKLLITSVILQFLPAGAPYSDEDIIAQFSENRNRCAANICEYEVPEIKDTKAPKGYAPFYISHYSRHGCRYLATASNFDIVDSLELYGSRGWLTPEGDSLLNDLKYIRKCHEGMLGHLTEKGARTQKGIGERLAARFPQVFRTKARTVNFYSTHIPRCIVSMANFSSSIIASNPGLEFNYITGDKYLPILAPRVSREPTASGIAHIKDSLLLAGDASHFAELIFSDRDSVAKSYGRDCPFHRIMYSCYFPAVTVSIDDSLPDALRYFTDRELLACYKEYNLECCAFYGNLAGWFDEWPVKCGLPVLKLIVDEADEAIKGGKVCADFRFGHDGGIGPLMAVLGLDGNEKGVPAGECHAYWPAWKGIPMATNLQIIFYRNKSNDIMVKFLRNEEEVLIPALESKTAPYYRWNDIKKFIENRYDNN